MNTKEAIERIKTRFDKWALDNEDTEAIQTLIPELAENEDERIRKALIEVFKKKLEKGFEWVEYGIPNRSVLDWLEKQKEQKPAQYDLDVLEKHITKDSISELAHTVMIRNGWDIVEQEQKLAEKPINWTELTWKDINELEGIINKVHYEFRNGIGQESFGKEVLERFREYKGDEYLDEIEQKSVEWSELQSEFKNINEAFEDGKKEVAAHPEKYGLCKSTEWSEGDENKLYQVVETLLADKTITLRENPHCKALHRAYDELIDWLKSLPERLNLQPKQVWSDEDEDYLMDVKAAVNDYFDEGYAEELCDWLKSLPLNLKKRNENVAKLCSNEWSEEDETRLKAIKEELERFIMFNRYGTPLSVDDISWLESLPERFNLQPKQEWSEDDEHCIELLDTIIDSSALIPKNRIKCHSFLKSLRPSWKPSEEQMKALEKVRTIFHHYHLWDEINPILYDYEELMRDLQKL